MKTLIRTWGSMRIAITLLAVVTVAMAAGTIIESFRGTPVAHRLVYAASWFWLALALLGLSILCSFVDLWPWGRARAGYLMTHGSVLIILVGALITARYKIEGRLEIWEGEEASHITTSAGPGAPEGARHDLPFTVRLDAFEIDYYQGTRRPAMFRSRVTVREHGTARDARPAVIEMNRELEVAGYRLFQSSYQQTPERDQTVLLVSHDPGQAIVFLGYGVLLAGMTTVLVTRVVQRAAAAGRAAADRARVTRRAAAALSGLLLLAPGGAEASPVTDPETLDRLRRLPVQHDGRVMPLDTLAREAVWNVTGLRHWGEIDPVAQVVDWSIEPHRWSKEPMVRIKGRDLIAAAGLPEAARYASFDDLVRNPAVRAVIQEAREAAARDRPVRGVLAQARDLEGRLMWLQGFLARESIRPIPDPGDPAATWAPPGRLESAADLLAAGAPAAGAADRFTTEIRYNGLRPSRLAWWVLVAATVAALLAWTRERRLYDVLALLGLVGGSAVMTWGLAARWQVAGRIPASNMYESLLFLGWGVGIFALVALLFLRNRLVIFNAAAMAALTMALTDRLPIDPFVHPMPPVLSGTPWLAIHVPIIMLSYSVLALGVVVAHMQVGLAIVAPRNQALAFRMNDLLYWYLHVGSLLLVGGILTGSVWGASSWGRYWGWDPKEVWSLIAFLAYAAILHGRFDRILGPFGVAALSIVAFWTILMTYLGVNFVLTQGLHSYGFGGGAVARWMAGVGIVEAFFLVVGWLSYRNAAGRAPVVPTPA